MRSSRESTGGRSADCNEAPPCEVETKEGRGSVVVVEAASAKALWQSGSETAGLAVAER